MNWFFLKVVILSFLFLSCKGEKAQGPMLTKETKLVVLQTPKDTSQYVSNSIAGRISPPENYERIPFDTSSFAHYLRSLKLKPTGSSVQYYNGAIKSNNNVYTGVINLDIGEKDLHQCADAVMRLRAEYFWNVKEYDRIHFNFTNGHKVEYREWMQGKRMEVKGNKTKWVQETNPSNSYDDFWNYLELIFMYAGTASLEKEMQSIDISEVQVGDVLIQGGFPGHAVIIVDEAIHTHTGEKVFLLAQSYMPAQELQILVNREQQNLTPWYSLKKGTINTPEWSFTSSDLKRFTN